MKYLSKSIFKQVLECRTKLYYSSNHEYKNNDETDPFLAAIAEGGFQVGELARCYYPTGIEINSELSIEDNYKETQKLLKQKNVIIFEGAIIFGNMMAKFDILVKNDNKIQLIEVKSKSYNGGDYSEFLNSKNHTIKKDWIDYMYDIAFQKYILTKSYPNFNVESYLMLADKSKKTSVSDLNQKFLLIKDDVGRNVVLKNGKTDLDSLGEQILTTVNIDDIINIIESFTYTEGKSFEAWLKMISVAFENNTKLNTKLTKNCHTCQFNCTIDEEKLGLKNGKKECFINNKMIGEKNYNKPMIFDMWNYKLKNKKLDSGVVLFEDLKPSEFNVNLHNYNDVENYFKNLKSELTTYDRQLLQLWKTNTNNTEMYCNKDLLKNEMEKWIYPLHMIDFETTCVAIPFHKNMSPYEGIAFQFSHHIIHKDGKIEHYGEYINTEVGKFPNFEFVRELKKQLTNDIGSIFRYSPHENTFLNMILIQLLESSEPDKEILIDFIKTITHKSSSVKFYDYDIKNWCGERNMIDLWDILKKTYYNPYTNGSNSIKYVLPAILKSSDYLKSKYSNAIYGTDEMKSTNFKNQIWFKTDGDNIINPYKLLESAYNGVDPELIKTFIIDENIANGGAAMTAYAKLQFSNINKIEKKCIINALLKYCELDTLAMVMIFEHWNALIYEKKYISLPLKNSNVKIKQTKMKKSVSKKVQNVVQLDLFKQVDSETIGTLVKIKQKRVRTKKSIVMIPTEFWLRRYKKDSTRELEFKLKSNHYTIHQKTIMQEILKARAMTPIDTEKLVIKLKKNSTSILTRMHKSTKYTTFEREIMKEIITARAKKATK